MTGRAVSFTFTCIPEHVLWLILILTRVHYRVEPLGGEVAAVRGPDVAQRRATREREEEEKLCFPHPLTNANKQGEIGPVYKNWCYLYCLLLQIYQYLLLHQQILFLIPMSEEKMQR